MTDRREPKWFTQWRAQQAIEEEDASNDRLLSEWMMAASFISTVELANLDVGKSFTEIRHFRDELSRAIEMAYAANEPWLRLDERLRPGEMPPGGIGLVWLNLDPRAAALWLLSKPMYRHLVPPPWARVVLRDAKATLEETIGRRPARRARGPRPEKSERVMRDMQKMEEAAPGRLGKMLGKQMVEEFRASRTMCRELRNKILSESRCGGVSNSVKI